MPVLFLLIFIAFYVDKCCAKHEEHAIQLQEYLQSVVEPIQENFGCLEKYVPEENAEKCQTMDLIATKIGHIIQLLNAHGEKGNHPLEDVVKVEIENVIKAIDRATNERFEKIKAEMREQLEQKNLAKLVELEMEYNKLNAEEMTVNELKLLQNKLKRNMELMNEKNKNLKKNEKDITAKSEDDGHLELLYECKLILELLYKVAHSQHDKNCASCKNNSCQTNSVSRTKRDNHGCCNCCGIPYYQIGVSFFKLFGVMISVTYHSICFCFETLCYLGGQTVCTIVWPIVWSYVWVRNEHAANMFGKCKEPPATAFGMIGDSNVNHMLHDQQQPTCSCWGKMGHDIKNFWNKRMNKN